MKKLLNVLLIILLFVVTLTGCGKSNVDGTIIMGEDKPKNGVFKIGMTIDEAVTAINENELNLIKTTGDGWDDRGAYKINDEYNKFGATKGLLCSGKFFLGFSEDEKLVFAFYDSSRKIDTDIAIMEKMVTEKGLKITNTLNDAKALYGEPEQTIDINEESTLSVFKVSDDLYLQILSAKTETGEIISMLYAQTAMPDFFKQ